MEVYYGTFTKLRETETLGGPKQNPVSIRTQGKGTVNAHETEPDLPVSVWESLAEVWACHRVGGTGSSHPGRHSMLA